MLFFAEKQRISVSFGRFFGMIAIVRWALLLLSPPHILLWWFLAGFLNPAFFFGQLARECAESRSNDIDVAIKNPAFAGFRPNEGINRLS
jgi:hypothetical protein